MPAALLGLFLTLATLISARAADPVALTDLPSAVTEAIKKTLPDAKVVAATSEALNDYVYYEVSVTEGEVTRVVRLTEYGRIDSVKEVSK